MQRGQSPGKSLYDRVIEFNQHLNAVKSRDNTEMELLSEQAVRIGTNLSGSIRNFMPMRGRLWNTKCSL